MYKQKHSTGAYSGAASVSPSSSAIIIDSHPLAEQLRHKTGIANITHYLHWYAVYAHAILDEVGWLGWVYFP